jgi:hypothetical protein
MGSKEVFWPHSGTPWQRRMVSAWLWLCSFAYLGMFVASLFRMDWQLAPVTANPLLGADKQVLLNLGCVVTGCASWGGLHASGAVRMYCPTSWGEMPLARRAVTAMHRVPAITCSPAGGWALVY